MSFGGRIASPIEVHRLFGKEHPGTKQVSDAQNSG